MSSICPILSPQPLRKCSKESCPGQNISPDLTWHCFCCKGPIHLLCYGVRQAPEGIFINDNIIMVCDEYLSNPKESVSPKRNQPNANFIQRTIDLQSPTLSLSKTAQAITTPSRSNTAKQSHQIQTVMEALVQKVETQTATIAGLKVSVETMNDTISQQKLAVGESIKIGNENISLLKKSLKNTPNSNRKKSYADAAKEGLRKAAANETPRSTKPTHSTRSTKPVIPGTSSNVIGKPLSPKQLKRNDRPKAPPKPEKAIWISRIHRETTEEELAAYIKESIGITPGDFDVRKLVKKDRDISTYSFVSFRITCSSTNFNILMDPRHWPSNSQIPD